MKKKLNWPFLLFILYIISVVVIGAVAVAKASPL